MPKEERRISPAVIIIPMALGLAALVIAAAGKAKAAPVGYTCPYCGATFATYEELVTHVQSVHPGERIPLILVWE